jgi:glucose-1-phosphate cytidylyltransferase
VKVVILAGGLGTRIAEETLYRPKPMVEIGGRPILWHIMKIYAHHGLTDFVVCLGYKGEVIKEYFANFAMHNADMAIDVASGAIEYRHHAVEPWRVLLVDTGLNTMTGGRLKRVREHLGDGPFCFTYGDGLADIDISALLAFHRRGGRLATLTAVVPPARFGAVDLDGDTVRRFSEKPIGHDGYINGGFFVLEPAVIDRIEGDATQWEAAPLAQLAAAGQLGAYRHHGFWHAMDTLRDRTALEDAWAKGEAPWKVWR